MGGEVSPRVDPAGAAPAFRSFATADWRGEATTRLDAASLAGEACRLADPACATRTLHWGRNYLYVTTLELPEGAVEVVVKQFRHDGRRAQLDRRLKGSKAERSFRAAVALAAAGIPTPEPLLLVESTRPNGPSFFVCRLASGGLEARYYFRALLAGREAEEYPAVAPEALVDAIAHLLRRLHAVPCWHRDVSIGNLLITPGASPSEAPHLVLLDLNRCRLSRPLSTSERTRDLCRLPLLRPDLQARLLQAYWQGDLTAARRALYRLDQRLFLARHRIKPALRALGSRLRGLLAGRTVHPHIPLPPVGARVQDRAVWDPLSDQPHLHAGRSGRALVRLQAAPTHLRALAAATVGLVRARGRYRELLDGAFRQPGSIDGLGVALRPWPQDPPALLTAVDELGVRRFLLRLHPWAERHDDEEALARELAARGCELAFALPQTRELVRDRPRWRAAVAELAERFSPFGRHFQVGQAINRSKWGVWTPAEYLGLAADAAEILRQHPGVEILGPAVIDFEPHALAAVLGLGGPELRFDAVSALLYVDRRGAPENHQLGFDTLGKLALFRALAATSRRGADRLWVTEVNWPLREGPHSPAGRKVAVDEATQADYLARYALLALGSGLAERVYWWQLVAKGYGLIDPQPDGTLRRRPAFAALRGLRAHLADATVVGRRPAPPGTWWLEVRTRAGEARLLGWSTVGRLAAVPPAGLGTIREIAALGGGAPAPEAAAPILDATVRLFAVD
ncbi:MAG: hypothetical protein IPJ17_04095 [Holophagales bacterium]|nr:MAG: hypothetical protein IPJ17_04095 [Holophagales bacterium]